jgi:hypothetical protein
VIDSATRLCQRVVHRADAAQQKVHDFARCDARLLSADAEDELQLPVLHVAVPDDDEEQRGQEFSRPVRQTADSRLRIRDTVSLDSLCWIWIVL